MAFRIQGLDPAPFTHLYGRSDDDLASIGAQRLVVDAKPGFPDRIELRDLDPGETVILLNHEHLPVDTQYRSRHTVFVSRGTQTARDLITDPDVAYLPRALR